MINSIFKLNRVESVQQIESSATAEQIKKAITVRISLDAYLRIRKYVDLADGEVGGTLFGTVDIKSGVINIVSVDLPPQMVSSSSIEYKHIMPDAEQLVELVNAVRDSTGVSQGVKLLGTWHSHGTMGVFASVVDSDCAKKFLATPPVIPNTLFVSLVFNKQGNVFVRVDYVVDKSTIVFVEDLELFVEGDNRRKKFADVFEKYLLKNVSKIFKDEDKAEELADKLKEIRNDFAEDLFDEPEIPEKISDECEKLFAKNVYENESVKIKMLNVNHNKSFLDEELYASDIPDLVKQKEAIEKKIPLTFKKKHRKRLQKRVKQINSILRDYNSLYGV
jgi:hypothetical protein